MGQEWFALPPVRVEAVQSGVSPREVAKLISQEEELLIIQRLHSVLRPFILRRTKDLVLNELPERRIVDICVPMTKWQTSLYQRCSEQVIRLAEGRHSGKKTTSFNILV